MRIASRVLDRMDWRERIDIPKDQLHAYERYERARNVMKMSYGKFRDYAMAHFLTYLEDTEMGGDAFPAFQKWFSFRDIAVSWLPQIELKELLEMWCFFVGSAMWFRTGGDEECIHWEEARKLFGDIKRYKRYRLQMRRSVRDGNTALGERVRDAESTEYYQEVQRQRGELERPLISSDNV